jgi:hypothetical protein
MGSINSFPVAEKEPEEKQEKGQDVGQEVDTKEEPVISRLLNSIFYFIECVFIIISKGNYRLVAINNNRVLMDKNFQTLRGGKIALAKYFKNKGWKEEIKAEWSHKYPPDQDWLKEKLELLGA